MSWSYLDRGEALVIQRVLNMAVSKFVDDNLWLRNNIFRTKCTFNGKICDMIIDGGSYENVVSTYMVEKLGMKTEDHPEPYQLTWLKKETLLKAEGSNLFMKKTGFEGLIKTSPCVFTLVVVEENKIISEAPLQVQPLLREFADVIPDDIPPGLPTMRDIQHCIDFIPGSAISNRPTYRMNPKESGYHLIPMRPGDEWRQFQKTRDGMLRVDGMPFGMSNAPSTFMRLMNQHLSHLRQIFSVLRAHTLYANGKKCHFLVTEVTFLGFHGLTSFYRRFIWNFSSIIAPLTECMKDGRLTWTSEAAKVECDASGVGIGGVLSQTQRPIAFFSEKLNDARRKATKDVASAMAFVGDFLQAFSFVIDIRLGE
ncbi:reverse transcriptase domain-containing protein [Tanacetum coccineum]|uniref:Reverse transcriptase domain-containing protein n=1 Tax=Tanacetum coccineum TaxID=301880 RepID=A0ABQ5EAV5_9ASTR